MEIEYGLTLDDLEAFVRFHVKHGPKMKPNPVTLAATFTFFVVVCFSMVILAALLRHVLNNNLLAGLCYGIPVGLSVCILFLALLEKKSIVSNTVRFYDNPQSRWLLAWRRFRIDADGFEITSEYQHLRNAWSTVWLIDSTEDHAFVYMTLHQADVIPRRAFQNQRDFEAFVDLACRYHKGETPSPTSDVILDVLPTPSTDITRSPHS